MAKLTRILQNIFASTASAGQIGEFGSLAAGTPTTTVDPAVAQSLNNWKGGWFDAILGGNSPAIEDMNAVHFVTTYQLAYLFQAGIAEWQIATVYYTGSLVNSAGVVYVSLADDNTGNLVSDTTKWKIYSPPLTPTVQKFLTGTGTYTRPLNCKSIRVRMVGGGGGGGGGGTSGGTIGGTGGTSTFGTTLLSAVGGDGGNASGGVAGNGGTASLGSGPLGIALTGGTGGGGQTSSGQYAGGVGAATPFGGAGGNGVSGTNGTAGIANTGSGGGGGSSGAGASGSGGGAGGFIDAIINSPSATYAYAVGAGGTAGSAGASGTAGGAGGAGVIIVEESY